MKAFYMNAAIIVAWFMMFVIPSDAFLRHLCFNPLGFGRIDPIVSPGEAAEHVHHLHGASNLGLESVDATYLLSSNCTSCSITADKSVYWAPAMYFAHDNGSFFLLTTASAITIYYKLEKRANFLDRNYTIFPQGFRMVAGYNKKRTWTGPWPVPDQSTWGPEDTTQEALAEKAIGFNCLNYAGGHPEASLAFPYLRNKAFIDTECANGVRAELLFPSCWDGINLDSPDHKSHVVYPTLVQDGACPDTHPVFLPILFYETIWNTQQFAGEPGQYILANGDPTGFSYHGDFIAAWEDGVLQRMTDDPTCTDHDLNRRHTNGIQEECETIADTIQSQEDAAMCKLVVPEVLEHEDVNGPLSALPNNIKINGVRHDPGQEVPTPATTSPPTASPSSSIEVTGTDVPSSTTHSHGSPAFSAFSTTPAASLDSDATVSTSTFVTGGTVIELVIVQEVVTTTIIVNAAHSVQARHTHGHRHV